MIKLMWQFACCTNYQQVQKAKYIVQKMILDMWYTVSKPEKADFINIFLKLTLY